MRGESLFKVKFTFHELSYYCYQFLLYSSIYIRIQLTFYLAKPKWKKKFDKLKIKYKKFYDCKKNYSGVIRSLLCLLLDGTVSWLNLILWYQLLEGGIWLFSIIFNILPSLRLEWDILHLINVFQITCKVKVWHFRIYLVLKGKKSNQPKHYETFCFFIISWCVVPCYRVINT